MITTTGLTRIYGKGENAVTAVNNLDIRIDDGELVAITGKSGSGKTTLLNILGGLDKATGGSVCYDDTDITKLADTALANFRLNKIGFVFQFYDLIPELTAKENILLPSKLAKKGKTDISDTVKSWVSKICSADTLHSFQAVSNSVWLSQERLSMTPRFFFAMSLQATLTFRQETMFFRFSSTSTATTTAQ